MGTWTLVIMAGITGWGNGAVSFGTYPSEESCYRALAAIRAADQPVRESDKKGSWIAYCRPEQKP